MECHRVTWKSHIPRFNRSSAVATHVQIRDFPCHRITLLALATLAVINVAENDSMTLIFVGQIGSKESNIKKHDKSWLVVSNMFYFPFHIWDHPSH